MEEINNNNSNINTSFYNISNNKNIQNNANYRKNINNKMVGNAISAYLFIFFSWLYLFNSNKNIDNTFVKWHIKTAIIIHIWFLVTYIIFISNWLFRKISIIWFWLNNIIANIIFLWLLLLMIIWINKAKNKLTFNLSTNINISHTNNILDIDIDWDWKITEKEKLTISLSYIPFIWFINYAKYSNNKIIIESTRLNILVSIIIILLYIFKYENLAKLLSLFYIILVVFISINLFTRNELLRIKLPYFFSPEKIYFLLKISIKYLINYFNDIKFKDFKSLIIEENEIIKLNKQKDLILLNKKSELRPAKYLIYIPFINLIFLLFKNTKYCFHIINGIVITFIILLIMILWYYIKINNYIYLFILIPILFWIGFTKSKLNYKMPFIYDIYILFFNISSLLNFWINKINKKRKEVNEINLKAK